MIVNVAAPRTLDMADSYGLLSGQLIRHLARLGCYVNVSTLGAIDYATLPPDIAKSAAQPYRPTPGAIFLGYPTNYALHAAPPGPRIGITMFESSKLPPRWVPLLNELDAVIVPSHFCATTFQASGVTVPIHVVPLGLGEHFHYRKRSTDRPFTFLAFLDRGARKGGIIALQAFLRAFGDSVDYRLILKSRKSKVAWDFDNANVDLIARDMSEAELADLYGACDVMIAANKGEGFGLLPREFAATGGIALATEWGGTADDLDAWGWPLPYTLESADWGDIPYFRGQDLGVWANPDVEGVADVLCDVAAHRTWYARIATVRAAHVRGLYSWPRFAEQVLAIWQGVCDADRYRLRPLAA